MGQARGCKIRPYRPSRLTLFCFQDVPYLSPIVDQVKAEFAERLEMDSAIPQKRLKRTLGSATRKAAGH